MKSNIEYVNESHRERKGSDKRWKSAINVVKYQQVKYAYQKRQVSDDTTIKTLTPTPTPTTTTTKDGFTKQQRNALL